MDALQVLTKLFKSSGYNLWVVGGAVRDVLCGRIPHDLDLTTDCLPSEITTWDETIFEGYIIRVVPVGIEFGVVSVILTNQLTQEKAAFDVATLRTDCYLPIQGRWPIVKYTTNLVSDLARRDFTINAMAIEADKFSRLGFFDPQVCLIDPFRGAEHLAQHKLVAVGDARSRLEEDFLRSIRACRFAGYVNPSGIPGLNMDPDLAQAIRETCTGVKSLSPERIRDELLKMMQLPKPSICIEAMRHTGLLEQILPQLHENIGVEQNKHHAETVYEHLLLTCDALSPTMPVLRLIGLLHDVGKKATFAERDGAITFYTHEVAGSEIVYSIFSRLKFSREEREYASLLVRHHMFRFSFLDEDVAKRTRRSTVKRWLNKLRGYHWDVIKLRLADREGNLAKRDRPLMTEHIQALIDIVQDIETAQEPMGLSDLAFNGQDLIAMGQQPGPLFSAVLRHLLDRVLEEPALNTKEQLHTIASEFISSRVIKHQEITDNGNSC